MPDIEVNAGEIVRIPLSEVHTVILRPDRMKGLIFHVHKKGEPLRYDIE